MPLRLIIGIAAIFCLICGIACSDDAESQPSPTEPVALATEARPTASSAEAETAPVLPATVQDKDGNSVEITDVSRIVVLNGDLAEVVYALGLGDNVVGTDDSATYPPEALEKATIGYQRSLAAEGILSLNPTVIIGNDEAGPREVIDQIRGAGVPVFITANVTTLDGVATKIRTVASALGVPQRGEELAAETQAEIDEALALAATATDEPRVMFLYMRGSGTQMILGAGSRGDAMIEAAGAIDVGVEAGIHGAPITAEALVGAQPDVLLLLTAGLASVGGIDGLMQVPGVGDTPAGVNRNVIDLDDQYLLGLGPRTGQALHDLIVALHPDLA